MTLNECVYWIGTSVVLYDTAVGWALILLYTLRSNWQQFEEGRAWLTTKAVFTVVLTYLSVVTLSGPANLTDYPQRGLVRILIFIPVGIVFTWWIVIVARNQKRSRKEERNER